MDLAHDAAYRALATRDARFDGRFFVGVTSTRIYCRPVCRVKAPKSENCRFFDNAPSAEHAGFRPCLRCRPELAPGLSLTDSSHVLAQHAARMIDHAVRAGEPVRMPALAGRLGVTERHLRRVFADAHGVSPIDYLTTQRLLQAKQLLTDTRLPVTEVALACGFESLRRFNAVFAERCRLTPSQLRKDTKGTAQRDADDVPLRVRLGYRPPYDVEGMLSFWRQRTLPGIETVEADRMRRTLAFPARGGRPAATGWLEARFDAARNEVELRTSAEGARHAGLLVEAVRHAFDLDADPAATAAMQDELQARWPGAAPRAGLRVPGSFDGFETAVRIVLGQQISVAAARTIAGRLVARFGEPVQTPWPELHRAFPTAAVLAAATPESIGELGIVRQRVGALQALARAACEGLPLHRGAPVAATMAAIQALPGIGPWTAELLALRVLAWPDAFPSTDIGVLKAMGLGGAREAPAALAMAQAWRPWRSYAVIGLWRTLEAAPIDA
jgi:AraC family transcriptional regulator of adaptative response / DNA-3-methyladenine glycosylase II